MAKAPARAPADKVALFEKLVATCPDVERKGAMMPYTSINGHMFSLLTPEGQLALRLPDDEREAFLRKYKAKQPMQYGFVMKEYVEVPDALLKKTAQLRPYFLLSYTTIKALKPKATTKRKS